LFLYLIFDIAVCNNLFVTEKIFPFELFNAARDDDVPGLRAALESGQSLSTQRPENGFTPLHTAAFNGSVAFLREALQHPTADPWVRDRQEYVALDHASVRRDYAVMQLLYDAMYPNGEVPFPADPSEP
jgi:ankyrin repeat protein